MSVKQGASKGQTAIDLTKLNLMQVTA